MTTTDRAAIVAAMLDCLVIGAGVVGLATARYLSRAGLEVVVADAADAIGSQTSSRNSEVIHAGIYYRPGSLKARLCVAGRRALYRYCDLRNVPYRMCGKLLVAVDEAQRGVLDSLAAKAWNNGVDDLRALSRTEALSLEPQLECIAALLSPVTGIIDSHQLMLGYLADAEESGALLALRTPVLRAERQTGGWRIATGGREPAEISARWVVNAAGLRASEVALSFGLGAECVPPTWLAKGNYFTLSGGHPPFSRLIYPLPEAGGLGIHVTLDLGGRIRFGPDVEWIDTIDYSVDPARASRFYPAIRRYYPALADGALEPGYSGIRPRLTRDPKVEADFVIATETSHGGPGLVCLYGIESPGLTASLALAAAVGQAMGAAPCPEDKALLN